MHAAPDFLEAHYNLGLLLLRHQEFHAALIQFQNVLTLNPGNANALFYQGVIHLEFNNIEKAEKAFNDVLKQEPEHLLAWNNLGVIALKNEQGQLAVDYFTKVLTRDNDHQEARSNLAATFMSHDRFENALTHYAQLLKTAPKHPEYLYNAGVALMALGHLQEATLHFEQLLSLSPHHAALNNLAAIAIRLNQKDLAITRLQQALDLDPNDTASLHMLNALEGKAHSTHQSTDYATNLFNNYALQYDDHMQQHLQYQIPQHLMEICHKLAINHLDLTLDIGCGTGLCGAVLRPLTKQLIGVDIAAKMIAQAKNKHLYDTLIASEITAFLQQNQTNYNLIVAADTLPYFGELETLFTAINLRLVSNGYFIFSTEISTTDPWQLQASARFSHHKDYLQTLCEKNYWTLHQCKPVTARLQDNVPLQVYLVIAQKA